MATTVIYKKNLDELFSDAASVLIDEVRELDRPSINIAVPGGRSVVGLLKALAKQFDRLPEAQRSKLNFFMVDERLVGLEDADSNFRLVDELFFQLACDAKLLERSQLHPFILDASKEDSGIGKYQDELNKFGGKLDLVILGVGEDAHVAGLFPNHPANISNVKGYLTFHDSPKPPPYRMTASRPLVQDAAVAFALFVGEGKREALEKYRNRTFSEIECPAKMIDSIKKAFIVTDLG